MRIRNRTGSLGESSAGIGYRCRFRDGNVLFLYHPTPYNESSTCPPRQTFERYEPIVSFLIFVQPSRHRDVVLSFFPFFFFFSFFVFLCTRSRHAFSTQFFPPVRWSRLQRTAAAFLTRMMRTGLSSVSCVNRSVDVNDLRTVTITCIGVGHKIHLISCIVCRRD